MVVCLTSARFNMRADILRQGYEDNGEFKPTDQVGEWVMQEDPDSYEIIRKWQPVTVDDDNNSGTPNVTNTLESFNCIARGIVDGGIRVAGTTERFGQLYENVDYVKMTFPASTKISKRDRITNIRGRDGRILWKEEEQPNEPPTVFSVTGVTPIFDPFGRHIESFALLERAERQ